MGPQTDEALARPRTLVLLVGAPRSGTTWLQGMLGSHPRVASPQETDLFSRYVAPLDDAWRRQLEGDAAEWERRRFKGLSAVLTEAEFAEVVGDVVARVLDAVGRLKPGADVVLEKSPSHSLHAALVHRYAAGARFLHLVRDGRDVADSLVAAAEGWGSRWAPPTLKAAARMWVEHVEGARDASGTGAPYHEVRYEALRDGDAGALRDVFAFCGIEVDDAHARRLLGEHEFGSTAAAGALGSSILVGGEVARHDVEVREPAGFFRSGAVGGWRARWSSRERLLFDAVAGTLLVDLGYEPDGSWAGSPAARRRFLATARVRRLAAGAARRVARRAERLLDTVP